MLEDAMTSQFAPRAASGFKPAAAKLLVASLLALSLAGCKSIEEPGAYVAGWTLIEPSQRHPIMVSQQPATMNVRIARGSQGLTESQARQVAGFLEHYRIAGIGNSRLVIGVPAGGPNESAAMRAMTDVRRLVVDYGFSDSAIVTEPYHGGKDANAPIRLSYLHYVAEGPACGRWPTNVAEERRNLEYANFGCAQQRNLAAQIANPADLLGPRSMTASDAERRQVVMDKYEKGEPTAAIKPAEQASGVRGTN
jgi:pilus assembly protein CpaD